MVIADPWGRWSRILPEFVEEREHLTQIGLFKPGMTGKEGYTDEGIIAHWLAREVHPARAFYRTPVKLAEFYDWRVQRMPEKLALMRVGGCLDMLRDLEIAEPDLNYRHGPAWRLIF